MVWKAVEFNFSKAIQDKIQPKRVTIPPGFNITVNIELDEPFQKIILKNPSVMQQMQEVAKKKALAAIDDAVAAIKTADARAEKFDQKTADIFSKDLTSALEKRMQIAGAEMAKVSLDLIEYFKKSQKNLTNSRVKSGFKITAHTISITASTAVTVASHGAMTPFAGVAIARSTVAIAQEVAKLASSCTVLAKLVDKELLILKAVMGEKSKDLDFMDKLRKNGAETAMAVLSGVAVVESTSVKNVKGRIELHRIDIAKLDTKSKKYSEQIYKVMDLGKVWEKKVEDAIKAGLKPDKVSKVKAGLKSVEDALDKLLNSTIKVNEAVEKAWENQHRFEDTIKKLSEGVQAWTKWVDVVVGATVDIGIAVGKPDVIMEAVVNTFITVSNDAVQAAAG